MLSLLTETRSIRDRWVPELVLNWVVNIVFYIVFLIRVQNDLHYFLKDLNTSAVQGCSFQCLNWYFRRKYSRVSLKSQDIIFCRPPKDYFWAFFWRLLSLRQVIVQDEISIVENHEKCTILFYFSRNNKHNTRNTLQ